MLRISMKDALPFLLMEKSWYSEKEIPESEKAAMMWICICHDLEMAPGQNPSLLTLIFPMAGNPHRHSARMDARYIFLRTAKVVTADWTFTQRRWIPEVALAA